MKRKRNFKIFSIYYLNSSIFSLVTKIYNINVRHPLLYSFLLLICLPLTVNINLHSIYLHQHPNGNGKLGYFLYMIGFLVARLSLGIKGIQWYIGRSSVVNLNWMITLLLLLRITTDPLISLLLLLSHTHKSMISGLLS